jgi:uncharacterized protein YgbK (DUF1537 family)
MPALKLGIIADDLTGAMDSSGYFAQKGFSTVVVLRLGRSLTEDVVVVTTDSRADEPGVAAQKVRQAARRLAGRIVYKKIDSTLRGNIGAELSAAVDELGCGKAVVAPAFPAVGRTTVDGHLLVNGTRVAETQFASDPVSPVRESHIPTLLEGSTGQRVACIGIGHVEAGPEALHREISGMPQAIVVCDATEQAHLDAIALAAAPAAGHWLLCGSGGLARSMRLLLLNGRDATRRTPHRQAHGLALVVVGTRNKVAAEQLLKAKETLGLPILDLHVERVGGPSAPEEIGRIRERACRLLGQGKSLAITSTFSRYMPSLKGAVPNALAEAVASVLHAHRPSGLFLSGGDIASEVCRRLAVSAIRVYGEVEPGVPAGVIRGGKAQGMRVVTKAGGFGTDAVVAKSILYLEKGCLP